METESIEGEEVMTEAEKDALIRELAEALRGVIRLDDYYKKAKRELYQPGSMADENWKAARSALAKVPK